ncbi:DNA-binding response regulator [Streptomyces sp. NPDC019396]|uniref:helix-turn-helix transcriptional regulator n=1 Tax=Streptomyces sp. NPDC019396 TaxID=3154687 RepID=UPI00340E338F
MPHVITRPRRPVARRPVQPGKLELGRPFRGLDEVGAALTGLVQSARHELLTFDDPAGSPGVPEPFRALAGSCVHASLIAAMERATIRRVVPRHALPQLPPPDQLGGQARVTDSIPFKLVVADRTAAALPLDLRLHCNGLLLIRDPVVVQALVRTHQLWWEGGDEIQAADEGSMPAHLRPVLDALLAGLTDEAAATRLGISGRTYSRRVGELLSTLGTTSRFRAGAEAARRGWI